MASSPVNDANAAEIGAHRRQNELIKSESSLRLIHSMQVQPRLDRKSSGAKIIEIQPSARLHRSFNVFGSLFDLDVTVPQKLLQRA